MSKGACFSSWRSTPVVALDALAQYERARGLPVICIIMLLATRAALVLLILSIVKPIINKKQFDKLFSAI